LSKLKHKTMEALTSFIIENYPAIAFLIAGIIIGGIANKYRSMLTDTKKKVDEHTKKLNAYTKKTDNLPCDNHRRAIVNIEKSFLGKKRLIANLTIAYSPRKLSELGSDLYQCFHFLDDMLKKFFFGINQLTETTSIIYHGHNPTTVTVLPSTVSFLV